MKKGFFNTDAAKKAAYWADKRDRKKAAAAEAKKKAAEVPPAETKTTKEAKEPKGKGSPRSPAGKKRQIERRSSLVQRRKEF